MKLLGNLLLAFSLLTIFTTFSQDEADLPRSEEIELTKSKPYEVVDAPTKLYFSDFEGGILSVKILGRGRNEFVFQKFTGENLNQTSTKTEIIDIRGFNFEYIRQFGKKTYLFYSVYDKPNLSEQLFARRINVDSGGFESGDELLVKTDGKITGTSFVGYSSQGKFGIDISADESVFVIKYRYAPKERDNSLNHDILGMHVFNSDLEKLWSNDVKMPYTEAKMANLDFAIGSSGKGYFLIKKFKEAANRTNYNDPGNISFAILTVTEDGGIEEDDFDLPGDNLIDDVSIVENSKQDIVCAGYYRKPKGTGVEGTFVAILDKAGTMQDAILYEFSLDFIKLYWAASERSKKKLEKAEEEDELGLRNLRMRRINILSDGSIVLAGEVFYITTYTDSKGNTHTTYHYNDVIVTKINPNGELGWNQKLPKRSTFESFKLLVSENYCYILFSDNPKNAGIAENQNPYACRAGERQVITYRFNNDTGERKHLALFGFREIDGTPVYQYSLSRVVGITENSFAVEMYVKNKSDMMFKVTYEE